MPAEPLKLEEREEIRVGIERCEPDGMIAQRLGRHRCTINTEINRNGGRAGYTATAAQARADSERARPKEFKLVEHKVLAAHVEARLKDNDSPKRIAIELADGTYELGMTVSHEAIYTAIYGHGQRGLPKGLHAHLHRRRRYRKHRKDPAETPKANPLGDFRSIHDRPEQAAKRSRVGDLEGDLIIGAGGKSAIVTVFDRCSRHCWLADLPEDHGKDAVLAALIELLGRIPAHLRHTLTWDQGREMARWQDLEAATGITVYFADAHSPWQRPTNENGNGHLRRWYPKGTDLSRHHPEHLRHVENRLNTTPRPSLDGATAHDIYTQAVAMTD